MRGLQLYQTETDELIVIEEAIRQGCWLIADVPSNSPEIPRLQSLEDFQQFRSETRHFYIFSPTDKGGALSVRKVEKEGGHFFYVSPGVGTASIEFLGGGVFFSPETHVRLIRPGFLEYSPEYWTIDLSHKLASPTELESVFDRLSLVVKSHTARLKLGKSILWIGDEARSELIKGARLVGYETWNEVPALSKTSKRGWWPG